jgi:hypothetical protein
MKRALLLINIAVALALVSASASQAELAQHGENVMQQLRDGTCGTNGATFTTLTKATGSKDWNYATSDKHYTWYEKLFDFRID